MPPKKDNSANSKKEMNGVQKKPRKKCKTGKNDDCPSRIRKTGRVVLNSQARDIIAKVYEFMKKEALNEYAEKLTNARWRAATAVGVSEKTVTRILKEKGISFATGAAAVGTVAAGKLAAVNSIGQAAGAIASGNITGAVHDVGTAVSDVVAGDVAGVGVLAAGTAGAVGGLAGNIAEAVPKLAAHSELTAPKWPESNGHKLFLSQSSALSGIILASGVLAAETVVAGKLGAVQSLDHAIDAAATGNLTAAASDVHTAGHQIVSHDAAAGNILVNGAVGGGGMFKHSIFDF